MLQNLPELLYEPNLFMGLSFKPVNLKRGIYTHTVFSLNAFFKDTGEVEIFPDLSQYKLIRNGIIENITKWEDIYWELIQDPHRKFCVGFTHLTKRYDLETDGLNFTSYDTSLLSKQPDSEWFYKDTVHNTLEHFQIMEIK